ncbi:hypothetical protein ACVR05_09575 [Streptococcus caprae]|uniref:ATPase n=1 Tax=Streptococcus caprae TaxID=1640501 RepID=A0ABV8CU07_9STRE
MGAVFSSRDGIWNLSVCLSYTVLPEEVWDLLATSSGLQTWFPQLSIQQMSWEFDTGHSRTSFPIFVEEDRSKLMVEWKQAHLTFVCKDSELTITIQHPQTSPELTASDTNFFSLWLNQLDQLSYYLHGMSLSEPSNQLEKWQSFILEEINRLTD